MRKAKKSERQGHYLLEEAQICGMDMGLGIGHITDRSHLSLHDVGTGVNAESSGPTKWKRETRNPIRADGLFLAAPRRGEMSARTKTHTRGRGTTN
jgi:hypothetical protein